ncbi:unnamed protein product [Owenia fusiformis]|uniref:Uncharacterized protein n=1 Tax=Owenia fusiformis TaxID=6347 RepID=A0A8J1TUG3_OWEFU|nr:unnamed protein product [Owenia fusiformis]
MKVNAEACLIDGRCYAHLQSYANDSCQICNATENRNQWTRDYSKCMVGTQCFSEGSFRKNDTYCWNCKPNINNGNLTLDDDHCLIDGMCFQQLEADPSNKCNICNVTENTNSWSMHNNMCLVGNDCFENGDFKEGVPCMNCKPESNKNYLTLDPGFCFIDGDCYENGKSKLGDLCDMCDVSVNITRWTSITGCHKLPNQGLAPHVIGIIIGVGVLLFIAVIIVIVVSIKFKKQSKIDPMHTSMPHTKPDEGSDGDSRTTKGIADARL